VNRNALNFSGRTSTAKESPQSREAEGAVKLDPSASLIRRRRESLRFPPMECGRRDPIDTYPEGFMVAPMVMGLEPWELLAEAKRLERAGWAPWEIRDRLGLTCGGGR
jgi:hypothetical protein